MAEIDNNVMLCDNPISLDQIEKGLWLGECRDCFHRTECLRNTPLCSGVRLTIIIIFTILILLIDINVYFR